MDVLIYYLIRTNITSICLAWLWIVRTFARVGHSDECGSVNRPMCLIRN
jgi:hypothetical protein